MKFDPFSNKGLREASVYCYFKIFDAFYYTENLHLSLCFIFNCPPPRLNVET